MKRSFLLICCALAPLADQAAAASLKPYTTLSDSVVHLSDLFDGADNRPLGPGPEPGARIVVEAPQLTAIAHMFSVDWRPSSPGERAVLERPGRSLAKEDIMAPLRALLETAGAARDSEIELPGFTTPMLPTNTAPALDFSGLTYDATTGRFTTLLQATVSGTSPIQVRLSGRVVEMTELPVPRRAMMPGDVLSGSDLQWTRLRVGVVRGELVRTPAQADGQALRHALQPGQPILISDLGSPIIVLKGTPLLLEMSGPGLQVTAQGIAAEPGGIGDRIKVTNPYSRATIDAEITGSGRARVLPGAPTASTAIAQVAAR